jgi:hypothetical protein
MGKLGVVAVNSAEIDNLAVVVMDIDGNSYQL